MDVSIRKVPHDLWHRVRRAAAAVSNERRVTIREVILEAIEEWLNKRGF